MKIIVSHDTNVEEKAAAEGEIAIKPKVHFSLLGAIGVQYSVTSAPIAIGAYLSLAIGLGGSPAYFWGFFMVGFFQLFVCLATAELASAIPHSSGELSKPLYAQRIIYCWTNQSTPPKKRPSILGHRSRKPPILPRPGLYYGMVDKCRLVLCIRRQYPVSRTDYNGSH